MMQRRVVRSALARRARGRVSVIAAATCLCIATRGASATATTSTATTANADGTPVRRLLYDHDSFLSGSSAMYLDGLYQSWKRDPASVDATWAALFARADASDFEQPLLSSPLHVLPAVPPGRAAGEVKQSLDDCGRVTWMIRAFEDRGHLMARTDPLANDEIDYGDGGHITGGGGDNNNNGGSSEAARASSGGGDDGDDRGRPAADVAAATANALHRSPLYKARSRLRLDGAYFGFSDADMDRVVRVGFQDNVGGLFNTSSPPMTIRQLHTLLLRRYCGRVGYELTHVSDQAAKMFLRSQIEIAGQESALQRSMTASEKRRIWDLVASAVHFEDFFKRKFATQKRFGCDGAETLVLGLRALLEAAATFGVRKINLGMAHRGRLNVLYHIIGKPFEVILKEFVGITGDELLPFRIQSDVKYHLGARAQLRLADDGATTMETEMLCNPSHLEAVNPLVQGYTRACQVHYSNNSSSDADGRARVMPIEIHGDAAFTGQGVAFESMCISAVGEHDTGGTIHVVCNNQIGFTTDPVYSRSSAYCTDLGRVFDCPILHVNGDSPEDVARVFAFAAEYRARFAKSIVIDLVCYRRYGHNESDDPSITQPHMYERIRATPDVFSKYTAALIAERVVTPSEATAKVVAEKQRYGAYVDAASRVHYASYLKQSIPEAWRHMRYSDELGHVTLQPTNTTRAVVDTVLRALRRLPDDDFVVHAKLRGVLERRYESIASGHGIDWGAAEALAWGSLLLEGHDIRVFGEDVERGTFSQRHAVLHDTAAQRTYTPLAHLAEVSSGSNDNNSDNSDSSEAADAERNNNNNTTTAARTSRCGRFVITNGPLSEYGMLGYAAGYSLCDPNTLVMWEAQYGDFANGAAIIFDQFLSAGESKWNQQQSCIVALPHGYDGKGPEHSSGRLERFLQMSNEDATACEEAATYTRAERAHRVNWEVVCPTTPAQYFHLLRRHLKRDFRKPLILFFSKQYLRAPNVSSIDELLHGGFEPVMGDVRGIGGAQARRLVLCTGQIYHTLSKERDARGVGDVALVRLEELSPFPVAEVRALLDEYAAAELMWAQEEPKNMGAWAHVEERIDAYTRGTRPLRYAGRAISASTATGHKARHDAEQERICDTVFG